MAVKKKTEPAVKQTPEAVAPQESELFYDEIVVPQELIEQVQAEEKVEVSQNPIVRILQKTPSGFNVLRADGTREKLTKAQYRLEVEN